MAYTVREPELATAEDVLGNARRIAITSMCTTECEIILDGQDVLKFPRDAVVWH
jgi:hypothetical protein